MSDLFGVQWLSVPVCRSSGLRVADARIDATQHRWIDRHIGRLRRAYPKHSEVAGNFVDRLEDVLRGTGDSLLGVNMRSMDLLVQVLGLDAPSIRLQSSIQTSHRKRHRTELAAELNATAYLAGRVERRVMVDSGELNQMISAGFSVWASPAVGDPEFPSDVVEKLSAVHAICTIGPERTKHMLNRLVATLTSRRTLLSPET